MNKILVSHFMEDDTPIVSVQIKNSDKPVTLWQQDFDDLLAQGLSPIWRFDQGQIYEEGTKLSVTRLVADAQAKQKVFLKDQDPFNLKRSNIVVRPGNGKFSAKDKLHTEERPHRLNQIKLEHIYNNPKVLEQL